jgi:alkylated DNA repair dioxygenase AlkB
LPKITAGPRDPGAILAAESPQAEGVSVALPDAGLILFERVDLGCDPQDLLRRLIEDTPWRAEDITLFGKTYPQPRLLAWYGDEGARYTYSGICHQPMPWTEPLLQLKDIAQTLARSRFNSVLLNYYRDQRDSMGLHADDEPELGPEPVIASLSLGAERKLVFKHRRREFDSFSLALPSGSLLVMKGSTQRNWKHGIRKLTRPCGPRVNLTFRWIVPAPE